MGVPLQLLETVRNNSMRQPSAPITLLVKEILALYGEAVQAVLFYGSCLHKDEDLDGLFDLYIIVDTYGSVNKNRFLAALNKLLPPNVFYLEVPYQEQTVRAKYAILSLVDLKKGTSNSWFQSYLWARFCQPTSIVFVRNERVTELVNQAFSQAVITFINRVLPRMGNTFTIRELWSKGLELTYRAEFRPEQPDKQVRLFDINPDYFKSISCEAFNASTYQIASCDRQGSTSYIAGIPSSVRFTSRISWSIRIIQGKALTVLRLLKGTLTFEGGVDYILWKINRHSGVTLEASPFLKRHPVLAMFVLSWRLYGRGGIR